jgi:hypothetical protein
MFDGASVARETSETYHGSDDQEWRRAHRELKRLARERALHDFEAAQWIAAARRFQTHRRLGFASLAEYLGRMFGWSPRLAFEKIRVAEQLQQLHELADALHDGLLSWSAARELTRVATPSTECDWLEAVKGLSIREVERLVAGRQPGDKPNDRVRPELVKYTIHVEVSGETFALWREAKMIMQRRAGAALPEAQAVAMILRTALGGPRDEGRSSYQIVISKCPDCGRATQRGGGEEIHVSPAALASAECDAQRIDATQQTAPHAAQEIPLAVRRAVIHRDHGRCVVPGCRHAAFIDLHHLNLRSEGGSHDPRFLITLCSVHHVQAHEGRLIIEGDAMSGLGFKHADGTAYGADVDPERADVMTDLFQALVGLGFRQRDSRWAVDQARAHVGDRGGSFDAVMRYALRRLRKNRSPCSGTGDERG